MKDEEQKRSLRLKVLKTEDRQSLFFNQQLSPEEILARFGPPRSLLSSSSKAEKSLGVGVLNRVLYFTSGVFCPSATRNCRRLCLGHTSGRMTMEVSARARDKRAALYLADKNRFLERLRWELAELCDEAELQGMIPAVRLNGCSDIPWELEHRDLIEEFHADGLQFFDYTKIASRYRGFLTEKRTAWRDRWPENYHLCFSLSEHENNVAQAIEFLGAGGTVAIVFWPYKPEMWNGFPVLDGDRHDARFLDPAGVVVGLSAKATARDDLSGFVVRTDESYAPPSRLQSC